MFKEIEKFMNNANASLKYRYINIGGNCLYVEGIKNIIELSENRVQVKLKDSVLEIIGNVLKVKYLDTTKPYLTCDKNNLKYLKNI